MECKIVFLHKKPSNKAETASLEGLFFLLLQIYHMDWYRVFDNELVILKLYWREPF